MPTTTPTTITPDILAFCQTITADHEPVFIPVEVPRTSLPLMCFENIKLVAGTPVMGWIIWERAGAFVEAEHHAVSVIDGKMVDVTSHDGETMVLFLRDDLATFNGKVGRSNIRMATNADPIVTDFVEAANVLDKPNRRMRMYGVASLSNAQRTNAMNLAQDFMTKLAALSHKYP